METGIGTSTLRSLGRRAPVREVRALLEAAQAAGVRYIDTADTYGAGSAERALAEAVRGSTDLASAGRRWRVVTKGGYRTPDLPGPLAVLNQPAKKLVQRRAEQAFDDRALRSAWGASRRRLGALPVHAYCLHNPGIEVLEDGAALATLHALRDGGAFPLAGVSVDDPDTFDVLSRLDGVDLIELPAELWLAADRETRAGLRRREVEIVVNRVSAVGRNVQAGLDRLATMTEPPDVAMVGTRSPAHLADNARAAGT